MKINFRFLYVIFSIIYISTSTHLPVSLYAINYGDDALFWNNAINIINGNWLGSYFAPTLAKGPGYSLFLVLNYIIGFPITLSLCLLYLFSCAYLTKILKNAGLGEIASLLLFVIILFQPNMFPTRIIRDNIYASLVIIIISTYCGILTNQISSKNIKNLIFSGLIFGIYWITREEGIWIFLSIFFAMGFFVLKEQNKIEGIKSLIGINSIIISAALIPILSVGFINFNIYGRFEVVDFKGRAFSNALSQIYRVKIGEEVPYLPARFEKRSAIYKISPAFKELEPYLEGENTNIYKKLGCTLFPDYYAHTCNDYAAGWWIWVFREAVNNKGYYKNPNLAAEYYDKISSDIINACNSNLIECHSNFISLIPPMSQSQISNFPHKMLNAINFSLSVPYEIVGTRSTGNVDEIQAAKEILRFPPSIHGDDYRGPNSDNFALKIKSKLLIWYGKISYSLVYSGAILFILSLFFAFKDRNLGNMIILSGIFWVAYLSRIFIVALVDLTAIPALNSQYISVAFILPLIASILSIKSFLSKFKYQK